METDMAGSMQNSTRGPCLILEGLSKAYSGLQALHDIHLTVEPGARRAIIGPNGAGKTTLFNLISGGLSPTSGRIIYWGDNINRVPAHRRAHLGIARTFQVTNLFVRLTVLENFLLACQAQDRIKFVMFRRQSSYRRLRDRALDLLKRFDLWEQRQEIVANLSYGHQRKIEVALALAGQPQLLLLDEPTAGLSSAETDDLVSLLKGLDPSMTVLLIEHDMDVAFEFCQHITVLHLGKLLADGTKDEVKNNPRVQEIYLGAR